ncbi:DUF4349 domain-containing protein [Mesoterricola silvestris]|uniref:DUF4349 domain-containing protein n=1 Tax=Mesoterricola silvestris TaxID=2927979 RepID=A0AA48GN19_9BACT|nr:DUF4349 domain-containing protein [Mesoterricola silvestris]BDU72535.1 hypothetical protein METEAL_17090 [Mesoterricola silvestris]
MKWPWWKAALVSVPAILILLVATGSITNEHRVRTWRPDPQNASGPKQIWEASSPGAGVLSFFQPDSPSKKVMKTMGVDLSEQADKAKSPAPDPTTNPQKLIRTGQVSLEVKDYEIAVKGLEQVVSSSGGYVANTEVQRSASGARTGQVTLRVPAAVFKDAGSRIRSIGKVLSERTNIEDVTKAYTDLETRLRVKREALNRLREILRAKAGSLKDVLEVEKEISRITEEIELAEGQRRYFDNQIQLSTITVDLAEPEPISMARPSSWLALTEALRDSAAMIAGSCAFLLRLFLVLLPWAGIGLLVVWVYRKKKGKVKITS